MSEECCIEFRVPVTKILDIGPHSNAERLEIARVFDFAVVVRRGQYKIGDSIIYVPIDSLLPAELEAKIFGPDSKIKLNKGRVKQIRIRGVASQGMLIDINDVREYLGFTGNEHHKLDLTEGDNLAETLGITKYEPEIPMFDLNTPKVRKERNRVNENPYFHMYGGLQNIKYYPDMFPEGSDVVYQEKIHGSNFRAGMLPAEPKTLWQKFLKLVGKFPAYQFCYGSNMTQRQEKRDTKTYYGDDVYYQMVKKYDLENKLLPGETVYAELFGPGIQKNYSYGLIELELVVFDVKVLAADKKSTQWLTPDQVKEFCKQRRLPIVPELYRGPHSKELQQQYTKGPSVIGTQPIREGIVIRDPQSTECYAGKKMFKLLSEDFLDLKDTSDFH